MFWNLSFHIAIVEVSLCYCDALTYYIRSLRFYQDTLVLSKYGEAERWVKELRRMKLYMICAESMMLLGLTLRNTSLRCKNRSRPLSQVMILHHYSSYDVSFWYPNVQCRASDVDDYKMMADFLPLLREVLPTAAEEIEHDIDEMPKKGMSPQLVLFVVYVLFANHGLFPSL